MPHARTPGPRHHGGHTLIEMSFVLAVLGVLAATVAASGASLDRWSLERAARATEHQLAQARLRAVAHRDRIRIRRGGTGTLETVDAAGNVIERLDLSGRWIDSLRVRPTAIRYNPRGHGAAGSVLLYRGDRGIRVVSNFVGRVRRHAFRP